MNAMDHEWRDLMADWQSEPEEAVSSPLSEETRKRIRRKVQRHGHWMVLLTLSELTGCAAMLVWIWKESLEQPRAIGTVGFVGTVILIVVALAFSFWNRRGTWKPATESTRTFVELSLERQRRKLAALRFCPWFLALELAFLIPWSIWALVSQPSEPWRWLFAFGWMAGMSALMLAWWAWYKRKTLREMAEWEELWRGLHESG
ncbi:MAG TPA: hypothetical protein VN493_12390 [Thermoanaerobaculia bacterium]|nr:hypothetical protein [Thermoanaerobaculia bacterium]